MRPLISLEGCAVPEDNVRPEERVPRRRFGERIRYWHITVFLIVVILSALGFAQKIDDYAERMEVVHHINFSCGL